MSPTLLGYVLPKSSWGSQDMVGHNRGPVQEKSRYSNFGGYGSNFTQKWHFFYQFFAHGIDSTHRLTNAGLGLPCINVLITFAFDPLDHGNWIINESRIFDGKSPYYGTRKGGFSSWQIIIIFANQNQIGMLRNRLIHSVFPMRVDSNKSI